MSYFCAGSARAKIRRFYQLNHPTIPLILRILNIRKIKESLMAITATCPGCGASLSIDENQRSVTCQFCGNHFNVNLDETAPTFEKAVPPAEPPPTAPQQPLSGAASSPLPEASPQAGDELYNPPIPGASSSSSQDVYNPPLEDISSGSSQTYTPPPFTAPPEQPLINRITGNRLWIGIAIAVMVIFCISCLCMVAIARGIFR
jgi:hypothetical protein